MRKLRNPRAEHDGAAAGLNADRWPEVGLRIGISGWRYEPWRGVFYPAKWPQRRELEFASRTLNSIELNGSFYSLQRPSSYRSWYELTPAGFVFSIKGPRFITHMKKLRDVETPLANFFASGVLCLREKIGPILWQFPPNFGWNPERFETFFAMLPRDTAAAARLSRKHDGKLAGRSWTKADAERSLRYAVEIRHPSFINAQFFALLRKHRIAFVIADTAGRWPYAEDVTADFVYCRLHGDEVLYVSGYNEGAIESWKIRVEAWRAGKQAPGARLVTPAGRPTAKRDVFVYFDNDAKVHAPYDAKQLASRFGIFPRPGGPESGLG